MRSLFLLTTLLFFSCSPSEAIKEPTCEIEIINAPSTLPARDFWTLFDGIPPQEVGKASAKEQLFVVGACQRDTLVKIWTNQACDLGANAIVIGGIEGHLLGTAVPGTISDDCFLQARARFFSVDK